MAKAVTSKPSALSLRRAVKPLMIPASSSARTRRKQGGAEIPTLRARSTLVIRPSACSSRRIRQSVASSRAERMHLLPGRLGDRGLEGAETPCLGSLRAILSPLAKRIEKKLGVVRSGNFGRPGARPPGPRAQSPAPEDAAALIATSRKAIAAKTWIITDGSVCMEAQGIAVAEAVGLPFSLKRVRVTGAMRLLPARLQIHVPPGRLLRSVSSNEPLEAPWPRLVISIGRRSVPIALAIKRLSDPPAFALHIQNPKVPPKLFDLIAAPVHDDFEAPNVIVTFGAVHSVTPARLAEAAKRFASQVDPLPHPRITVLLGGESQAFSFPPEDAATFGAKLAALAKASGGTLLVTPSRPPPPAALAALSHAIKGVPHIVWDGTGDNPYFAFLGLADAIVVTADSVNMVTEAAGTGKPVYVQALPGRSRRLSRFHRLMQERGATRPFEGKIETWSYAPINDTEIVASAIRRALGIETKA